MTTSIHSTDTPGRTTRTRTPPAPTGTPSATRNRQTLGRAIHFEWIKLRTLRSTWIGMASVILIMIGFGAISAAASSGSVETPDGGRGFGGGDPLATVLQGANFAVLLVGVLGSLAGAREYSSRLIAASVAAVPRRWQIVVSKAVVLVGVTLPTALIGVFGAYGVGTMILSASDAPTVALSDSGVLSSLLGMAGYITAIALLGLSLGVLLRSVAGSIGILVAGVLLLPTLAGALLPDSFDKFLQYLPTSAASSFTTVMSAGSATLGATAGALVLLAWVAAGLGAAATAITRRDV